MRPSRVIAGLGILIIMVLLSGAALFLADKRDAVLLDARRDTDNLMLALSMETSRSPEAVDLLLRQRIAEMHAANVSDVKTFQAYASTLATPEALTSEATRLPQVDLLSLVSADGKVINFDRYWQIPEISLNDRDYYKALARGGTRQRPVTGVDEEIADAGPVIDARQQGVIDRGPARCRALPRVIRPARHQIVYERCPSS